MEHFDTLRSSENTRPRNSSAALLILVLGQLVSGIGSNLSGFALGIWVYRETGSVSNFSLISLSAILPGILLSPLAGVLIDRWNRRRTLIWSNCVAAISTLLITFMIMSGNMELWQIYAATAINAICGTFQIPAFTASLPLIVPKEQLARANGIAQLAPAVGQLVGPALAGALVLLVELHTILLIDALSFLFAAFTPLLVMIPQPVARVTDTSSYQSFWGEAAHGWNYLRERPGLLMLQLVTAGNNFLFGLVIVLFTPLGLSFASEKAVGTIISIASMGMLAGSLVLGIWGGPRRRVRGILLSALIAGLCMILGGLYPSIVLLGIAAFGYLFVAPIANGCITTIMQQKVAPEIQGRVFATCRMLTMSTSPIAFLIAGPLSDNVFEPLMAVSGPLAGTVGQVIGVGPGRGIALLCIVAGLCTIPMVLLGYLSPRLRMVEQELPDALPSTTGVF